MKKKIVVTGGIVILAGAIGAGAWYYLRGRDNTVSSGEVAYVTKIGDMKEEDAGILNRFAGVVEPQETVKVNIENGRKVKEVQVKTGEEVKAGQLLFEYDLTSIEEDLQEARLALDRLKNEALSLNEQISTLEKEKKKASKNNQLSYTIEIETNKMNLKKNEYSQESKQAEIDKLQSATTNTEVRSEIDGVIQKIDTTKLSSDDGDTLDDDSAGMDYSSDSSDNSAFITILITGAYRIKGKVNEMNRYSIVQGEPVIVRSRVDDQQIWHGTMGAIDEQSSNSSSGNGNYGMVDSSGDSDTTSSTYPFYVDLETSDGLMLGQHVYIEKDEGQEDKKEGVWLSDFYIVDADSQDPYVWAADEDGKLKKRKVVLGQYDEGLMEYEIADGLTEDDSIAFPTEALTEGLNTADAASMPSGASMYYGEDSTDSSDGTDNLDGSDDADDSQSYDGEEDADPIMDESSGGGYMDDYSDEDMQPDEELGDGDVIGGADSMDEDFDAYTQDYTDDMNSDVQYGADDTEAAG